MSSYNFVEKFTIVQSAAKFTFAAAAINERRLKYIYLLFTS